MDRGGLTLLWRETDEDTAERGLELRARDDTFTDRVSL